MPDMSQDNLAGVVFEPMAGYCDAQATARYLARRAIASGANFFENSPVNRILIEKGKVQGIESGHTIVASPIVINAAGAWSPQLATACGFPLPIQVTLQGIATFEVDEAFDYNCGYNERPLGFYMRPSGPKSYLIGSLFPSDTRAATIEERIRPVPTPTLARYAEYAAKRLSRFSRARIQNSRYSVFDETPDGNPLVGADPRVSGLWLATGLSGHGFKFCPAFGQGLTELITTGETAYNFERFALARFLK